MYAAKVQGRRLTFEVAGVWRRNMLMRDRETGTIWQHATGEALMGPLKGETLTPLGGSVATWGAWKREYRATVLSVPPAGQPTGPLSLERLTRLLGIADRLHVPGLQVSDHRLGMHTEIAGIVVDGEARAYPLELLRRQLRVTDRIQGREVVLVYDPAEDWVKAFSGEQALEVARQWWLGWSEFHPGTGLYTG